MQLLKVLNNSLVLAIDQSGNEYILMGKGLGYHKAIGNQISVGEIEKTFVLQDKKMLSNFVQMASQLEERYFTIVQQIIAYAYDTYGMEVMDYLYLTLSDHLSFVARRAEEGLLGDSFKYVEIINFHQEEYTVGRYGVALMNETLGLTLPDSEASAIGLHFVNARMNSQSYHREEELNKLIRDIEKIVSRTAGVIFNKETFSYSRFIVHLNYFGQRLLDRKLLEDDESDQLYDQLFIKGAIESTAIDNIASLVQRTHRVVLSKQEKIYLIIHVHRLIIESRGM